MIRPDGTKSAKIVQVIVTQSQRGLGTAKDPVREVTQYWDLEGNFLAEMDVEHCIPVLQYEALALRDSTQKD